MGRNGSKTRNPWEYAMYKGDTLVCIGTKAEICAKTGLSPATFGFYRTNYYKNERYLKPTKVYKKNMNLGRVIVRIDGKDKIWNEEKL